MIEKPYQVLLITKDLYPQLSANSEIAYRIGNVLKTKYKCDITVMSRSKNPNLEKKDPYGFESISIRSLAETDEILNSKKNKVLRWIKLALFYPDCFRFTVNNMKKAKHSVYVEYMHAIDKICAKKKFDCIIAFNPYDSIQALTRLHLPIPFISYKLDPWATHYQICNNEILISEDAAIAKEELDCDTASAAIIATNLIYEEYLNNPERQKVLNKVLPLEFPNLIKPSPAEPSFGFEKEAIHCVFVGSLYKDIRNPAYALKLFSELKSSNIIFHIVGFFYGENPLPDVLPDNVIFHGKVDSEKALQYMQTADVLVNIGNTVLNQMPSKIITYISLGKPILNIIKDEACPTLPYMEKYPLSLSVLETPELMDRDIERARGFIVSNKNKEIPFEEIEKLFYDCTPEYVGGKVYETVCKVVEENRAKEKR